jgi:hypothetical protein
MGAASHHIALGLAFGVALGAAADGLVERPR